MMTNKKMLIAIVMLVSMATSFVGCTKEDEANVENNEVKTVQASKVGETDQKTEEETENESEEETTSEAEEETDEEEEGSGAPKLKANLAEIRDQVYNREELVNKLDKNGDGYVTIKEYNGTLKLFKDMDLDGDNRLSDKETKYMMTFEDIPTGSFIMGTDDPITAFGQLQEASSPAHTVTIDGFKMASTELTTAQYCLYLNSALKAGQITVELGDNSAIEKERMIYPVPTYEVKGAPGTTYAGNLFMQLSRVAGISHEYDENSPLLIPMHPLNQCWIYYVPDMEKFYVDPGFENWPASYVKFYGAMAFSEYYDLSLPTEAEWEYVASGGQQFEFPTVDGTNDGDKSNYACFNVENKEDFEGEDEPENYVGFRLDVGKYPANPYGVYDLAGNVWEWTLDWYDEAFYQYCINNGITRNPLNIDGHEDPPADKVGVTGGPGQSFSHGARVCKGGSYNYHEDMTYTTYRFPVYYYIANDHFGARFVIRSSNVEFNGK